MDQANAKVVRLTPEQEAARQRELAARMRAREDKLRATRFEQYLQLKAEFDALPPDELTRLKDRAELAKDAEKFNGGLVLSFNRVAHKAKLWIEGLRDRFVWAIVKKMAIASGAAAALFLGGSFSVECVKSDGATRWVDIIAPNGVTTAGLNHVLDTVFHAGTQVTTWYIGLVQGSSTPTFAAADTMGSHAGWTEYTAYSQTNRVAWDEGAASAGSMTNSVTSDFSMNATGTVAGLFITSSSTKSGTTGTLFSTASFSGGNQAVGNGDTLKVTYTLNATAS